MMNFLSKIIKNTQRVYLDYASLTPVDERVIKVMEKTMRMHSANPGSLYGEGVAAEKLLNKSRGDIARFFEVHADEIIFTSGGTEANNLAIKGIISGAIRKGVMKPHIISLTTEHPSIRELLNVLTEEGKCEVSYVPVTENGIIDIKEFKTAFRLETVLVSVMYANNEIGVIQPISEIAKVIRSFRKDNNSEYPYFHTDACQAAIYCPMRIPILGVDLMTIDGGKVYGPRGIGALYARRGIQKHLMSQILGGGQESNFRAGTENLPAIAGLAEALRICAKEKDSEIARLTPLRDWLIEEMKKIVPKATLNGSLINRLPNNINICLPGKDSEFEVLRLDVKGVCVSSVTSCRSKSEDSSSYVIEGIGKKECAASSLRITFGRYTTRSEINFFLKHFKKLNI
ncbi:MAG: cysteine desulfurase family protein [Patescibacteria group bacterium]